jgi:hypothetical protein
MALAVLAVLAIIMGAVFAQGLRGRRMSDLRGERLQTLWLARSGLEVAGARLVGEPSYSGETITPLPDSLITIKVQRRGDDYILMSEARYAPENSTPLVRRLERHYRLIGKPGRRFLQASGSEI